MLRDELIKEISKAIGSEADIKLVEPERSENGDYSTNIAFLLAKKMKNPPASGPNDVAEELAHKLRSGKSSIIDRVDSVGGFVNIWVKDDILIKKIGEKLEFSKKKEKINVEFVSANPTGPLTMANGRGGFYGDVLSNVLAKVGYDVTREYYINDAGNQVRLLGESIQAAEGKIPDQENYYKGKYVKDLVGKSAEEAIAILLDQIKTSLGKVGISFDEWFSEEINLRKTGEFERTLADFEKNGLLEKKDGATWWGDRVLIKSNGDPTYLLVDIAYQRNKILRRKFDMTITVIGADHHAEVEQVKKGMLALGIEAEKLKLIMIQFVRLIRGGKEVRMGKRTGAFVTVDELIDEVGVDVARWFFLERSPNTHMDFDLDLAREKSEKNPVYYVQYALVRMTSVLVKSNLDTRCPSAFAHYSERALALKILRLPDLLEDISRDYQVHRLTTYAYELAQIFSAFYRDVKVIGSDREEELLYLVSKTKETLGGVLEFLGISQPEKM